MKKWINYFIISFISFVGFGQGFPEGMPYQAQVLNSSGDMMNEMTVGVGFNIRQGEIDGEIVWGESHEVTLNDWSHFSLNVGTGISTGDGSLASFAEIDWGTDVYFLEMLLDEENIGSFSSVSTQQLMAVPYSFHSKTTSQKFSLSGLEDVDTMGIEIGDILKWNGLAWVPAEYDMPDSILHAVYSDTAHYADVALFAENCETPVWVDSAFYALKSDSSNFSLSSYAAVYSDSALFSDSAGVASFSLGNWGLNGNSATDETNFLGTLDSTDLIFKTNETERMRIKANGRLGIGTDDPQTDVHIHDINGMLLTGEFGLGEIPEEGAGTRMMWYPKKAAFRVGGVTGTTWNDGRIGNYSFSAGYNTRADGDYSVAFGSGSWAGDDGAFAAGLNAQARGLYSMAVGHAPAANGDYAVALGRAAIASAESAVAIGYHPTASGPFSLCLGNYSVSSGENSVSIGYRAQSNHDGTFVYNDYSEPGGTLSSSAANQFMVRAIGGFVFYTSADLSTGVELLPGAGAWSTLSDSTKKTNIQEVEPKDYLQALELLSVYEWSYKSQHDSIRHIGPMAQDFHKAFGLGADNTRINSGDFDGINLLLIKALQEEVNKKEVLKEEMAKLERLLEELTIQKQYIDERLKTLEKH
jgi:hypothetical protein